MSFLIALNAFLAALAAFRLTTLFNQEEIWEPIRRRFPAIPWGCMLCMSVWGGGVATVFFLTVPWLNWPLAFSWLYLAYKGHRNVLEKEAVPQPTPTLMPTPAPADDVPLRVNAMAQEDSNILQSLIERCRALAVANALANARIQALEAALSANEAPPNLHAVARTG